jgi:hypothetical protein
MFLRGGLDKEGGTSPGFSDSSAGFFGAKAYLTLSSTSRSVQLQGFRVEKGDAGLCLYVVLSGYEQAHIRVSAVYFDGLARGLGKGCLFADDGRRCEGGDWDR